jgi:hypothetical protein
MDDASSNIIVFRKSLHPSSMASVALPAAAMASGLILLAQPAHGLPSWFQGHSMPLA